MEVETPALANYMCSVWESSHTLPFTAAIPIYIYNTSGNIAHLLSMSCVIPPDFGCCRPKFIFHGKAK